MIREREGVRREEMREGGSEERGDDQREEGRGDREEREEMKGVGSQWLYSSR